MRPAKVIKRAVNAAPRSKVVKLGDPEALRAPVLAAGAHFAKLFKKLGEGRYEASLFEGGRVDVGVAPDVDLELADRCLAEQGVVLLGMLGKEAVVFGALETKVRKGDEVVIEAPQRLVLKVGKSKLVMSADGRVKLSADRMTVDAPREVRLASTHVEIP